MVDISNEGYYGSASNINPKLNGKLRWFLTSAFQQNNEKLRKIKDVKTLIDCYKKTREFGQQEDEHGILSIIVNELIGELLEQLEPYYIGSIVRKVEIETRFKEGGVIEINSNIGFGAPLKPYVEFVVEINKKESYSVKFTFQIDTSAHITRLRISSKANEDKSVHIEKLGLKIELSLIEVKFSNLITSRSEISLNKRINLGSKSFEIHDISVDRS